MGHASKSSPSETKQIHMDISIQIPSGELIHFKI